MRKLKFEVIPAYVRRIIVDNPKINTKEIPPKNKVINSFLEIRGCIYFNAAITYKKQNKKLPLTPFEKFLPKLKTE